jgi:uroporphyrinogen decarboxylase
MTSKPLLDVLCGRIPTRRPIWFMRQAGRYLPEYRAVRAKAGSFLDLCYSPELAAEVTIQPLRRFDLDAAILFADILVVPHAMGVDLRFAEGEGPVLSVVSDLAGVKALRPLAGTRQSEAVCQTVRLLRRELPEHVGLIGFCGGPWTVGSYMVEGGSSERINARVAAYRGEPWFDALLDRLVEESADYLSGQIEAGADAVQIFDSWAGELTGGARERCVVEPLRRLCEIVRGRHPQVPVIVFGRGMGRDHGRLSRVCGAGAVGVEAEEKLAAVLGEVAPGCAVQGNLDPVILLSSEDVVRLEVRRLLETVPMNRHVFNLGHGIRPQTNLEMLNVVVETVREFDARKA